MLDRKPFAALSSGLLARKGQAKPAMRRQFAPFEDLHHDSVEHDDLGWNDMGEDHGGFHAAPPAPASEPAPVAEQHSRLTEHYGAFEAVEPTLPLAPPSAPPPTVVRATRSDASERGDDIVMPGSMNGLVRRPVYEAVLDRLRGERRVALTLRIERTRHNELRTLMDRTGASAQALLARALDEFLDRQLRGHEG